MADPIYQSDSKLIACILPKGRARTLHQALIDDHDIHCGTFHYGRGVGRAARISDRGIGEQEEREVFEVVVESAKAEEIFEYLFFQAELDEPHGGMIYMTSLPRSTVMTLPDVPPEED